MNYLAKKGDNFYYIVVTDLETQRDSRISDLFGEDYYTYYIGPNNSKVDNLSQARFWKLKMAAERYVETLKKGHKDVMCIINVLTRDQFIEAIPEDLNNKDYVSKRNYKLRKDEISYINKKKEFRKKYKAIDAYIELDNPSYWLECPNCKLKPLTWEFNNGRSTACGCGNSIYDSFSIHAESIMSFVKRNDGSAINYKSTELCDNWNHWVKTGEILFDPKNRTDGKW